MMDKSENKSLFFFKALACFCVVTIHFRLPGKFGELFFVFSRFAVPFFFMISGYFSFFENKDKGIIVINRRIKKVLFLTAISFFFYFFVNIFVKLYEGSFLIWVNTYFLNVKSYIYLFVFNWTTPIIGVGSIWYLFAILYVYIIYKSILKHNLHKIFYVLTPVILGIVLIVEYLQFKKVININEVYYRNFLLTGLPFFMLGNMLRANLKNREKYIKYMPLLIVMTIILLVLTVNEYKVFGTSFSFYLSSILWGLEFFIIAIVRPSIFDFKYPCIIGKMYSTDIYIIHYFFIILFNLFLVKFQVIYKFGAIFIFILSLMASIGFNKVMKLTKKYRF